MSSDILTAYDFQMLCTAVQYSRGTVVLQGIPPTEVPRKFRASCLWNELEHPVPLRLHLPAAARPGLVYLAQWSSLTERMDVCSIYTGQQM